MKKWAQSLNRNFSKEDVWMANGHEKMLTTAIREMQTKLPWDTVKKSTNLDFHGDTVAKNSPSNAEYMALDPTCLGATKAMCHNHSGRVLQLMEPVHPEAMIHSKRGHHSEEPLYLKSGPCSLQLEKDHSKQQRLIATENKIKQINYFKI